LRPKTIGAADPGRSLRWRNQGPNDRDHGSKTSHLAPPVLWEAGALITIRLRSSSAIFRQQNFIAQSRL
jgi:hypothetical protein